MKTIYVVRLDSSYSDPYGDYDYESINLMAFYSEEEANTFATEVEADIILWCNSSTKDKPEYKYKDIMGKIIEITRYSHSRIFSVIPVNIK